ncbi:hypothetical protein L798_13991 [Zootermopsis nevadensis]|uniref:Uncharacterized protein n=1 Tax=Zootermopsis nevadensis TaxID=136037 RepID=A0A067QSC7_ZOONE|nr:hypothetical protein L798_13991 [Zootermopsis nevadensis]
MSGPTDRPPAETGPQGCRPGLPPSRSPRQRILPAQARWRRSGDSHHPLSNLPKRLVLAGQGFQRVAPLFVRPLVEPTGHRPLESVDLSFESGVPRDLPAPRQPVLRRISSRILAARGGRLSAQVQSDTQVGRSL